MLDEQNEENFTLEINSKTLFLKLTVSEIEFPTVTLASVAPSFLARSRQKEAFDFKYSSSLIMI